MSSQVNINFHFPNSTVITERAVVRHVRNYEKNSNDGVVVSPNGGHTIICMSDLSMYVAKCNYRTDKFSRKEGIKQALTKWLDHNQYTDLSVGKLKCHQDSVIDVFLVSDVFRVSEE